MKKLILLNGPPRSGKDTIAQLLHARCGAERLALADPIREAVAALLGVNVEAIERIKDRRLPGIHQITARDLMIRVSESVIKPVLGQDWWAKAALKMLKQSHLRDAGVIITDVGFAHEFITLVRGARDMRQVELWQVSRPGCDFTNDSREYVIDAIMGTEERGMSGAESSAEMLASVPVRFIENVGDLRELERDALFAWYADIKVSAPRPRNP